ncbi:FAD-dependent oxidoreductase [Sphingobacterium sp. UBA5996]|uniref:FAD-dependent oxidoreductase n=1 Tax=Sphingobacterium sp. UBA5996 TaxID=1947505 RepID=UPI0025EF4B35|nr:FAD-dependent oxidoreductase [Sphingobacterium sp. UBA5996]
MMKKIRVITIGLLTMFWHLVNGQTDRQVDLCIYGTTSAGVIAAYTASQAGKSVLLIDPGTRVGGLSSGGLGQTDIGNKYVVTGLALDFYRKMGKHYGSFEQWIFEPKVAESIFKDYLAHANTPMLMGHRLVAVKTDNRSIKTISLLPSEHRDGKMTTVSAKVFMDCSYEGDLMAKAGVSYHVGRESNSTYGETISGVQLLDGHQFPDGVDPYKIKGDPQSGILWGINTEPLKENGTGDTKVQAYNYRITLTNVPENRNAITKPQNYDATKYELLKRQKEIQPWKSIEDVFIWSLMPNGKTDINNRNGFSTDMIGMNWRYPEADYFERKEIIKAHEDYTKGLLYFVANDPSVPEAIRSEFKKWGYPKDEYLENSHWSPQLYIREARRMIADVVMTQHHCQGRARVSDGVGYAAYTMDSHNCDRVIVNGMVKNEGNVEVGGFSPFPISYRAIVPKKEEIDNLVVPVCLSASHIAFGSIRMEPVFMVLGQSGAVAACEAIDNKIAVQDVDIKRLTKILRDNPKADGRMADYIIHVENKDQVMLKGDWHVSSKKGYGMSYQEVDSDLAAVARFTPGKDFAAGKYKLYSYFPKTAESTEAGKFIIHTGKTRIEKKINFKEVHILGQTTSTWVALGEYEFENGGNKPYVEMMPAAKGVLAANALLWVPVTDQN